MRNNNNNININSPAERRWRSKQRRKAAERRAARRAAKAQEAAVALAAANDEAEVLAAQQVQAWKEERAKAHAEQQARREVQLASVPMEMSVTNYKQRSATSSVQKKEQLETVAALVASEITTEPKASTKQVMFVLSKSNCTTTIKAMAPELQVTRRASPTEEGRLTDEIVAETCMAEHQERSTDRTTEKLEKRQALLSLAEPEEEPHSPTEEGRLTDDIVAETNMAEHQDRSKDRTATKLKNMLQSPIEPDEVRLNLSPTTAGQLVTERVHAMTSAERRSRSQSRSASKASRHILGAVAPRQWVAPPSKQRLAMTKKFKNTSMAERAAERAASRQSQALRCIGNNTLNAPKSKRTTLKARPPSATARPTRMKLPSTGRFAAIVL